MSVITFYCPDGPFDVDDLGEETSLLEEVSFTNRTARDMLTALSLQQRSDPYVCGSVEPETIPSINRRIIFLLNNPPARQPFLRSSKEMRTTKVIDCPKTGLPRIVRGSRVFEGELTDQGIVRRLESLHQLLSQALEFGCSVHWG